MDIAVVGSFGSDLRGRWKSAGDVNTFQQACRSIGRVIARHRHRLIVQHDDKKNADPYVVEGYQEVARTTGDKGLCIEVVLPRDPDATVFEKQAQAFPWLFSYKTANSHKWDSARLAACQSADIVILIGGRSNTEVAGFVVLAAGKRVIPFAAFGGASAAILEEAAQRLLSKNPFPSPLNEQVLRQRWSDHLVEQMDAALRPSERKASLVVIHGRDQTGINQLATLLTSRIGSLPPKVMSMDYAEAGRTLPEKWEQVASQADAAIVMASPDDEGRLRNHENASLLAHRARQNVWLEYGWFWGRFASRSRLLLLVRREDDNLLEFPTDISGLDYLEWKDSLVEVYPAIEQFIRLIERKVGARGS